MDWSAQSHVPERASRGKRKSLGQKGRLTRKEIPAEPRGWKSDGEVKE